MGRHAAARVRRVCHGTLEEAAIRKIASSVGSYVLAKSLYSGQELAKAVGFAEKHVTATCQDRAKVRVAPASTSRLE
jgi:hypothetical protein